MSCVTMQEYLENEMEDTDDVKAYCKKNLFKKPLIREEKSLQEKLYDLYIEECEKEPEIRKFRSKETLLDKLMKREDFPCLVINLSQGNWDFTVMIKDKDSSISNCTTLPYSEETLLEYLAAEELPPFLLNILENSEVNLSHHGCVIAEIRDYRQYSKLAHYQSRHVLLKPTVQNLMESMRIGSHRWTPEEKFEVENQMLLAPADPLCLGASFLGNKNKLGNKQNMKKKSGKWSFLGSPWPSVNWQQELPKFTAPPELEAKISCRKRAEKRRGYPHNATILTTVKYVDTWKQKPCELDVPSHVDVQKYAKGKPSAPSGDSQKLACLTPEIREMLTWKPGCELKMHNKPFVPENIWAPKKSKHEHSMSASNIISGNSSNVFMANSDTVTICQKSVQTNPVFPGSLKTSPKSSDSAVKDCSGKESDLLTTRSVQRCPRPTQLALQVSNEMKFEHEVPAPAFLPLPPPPAPKPASLAQEFSTGVGQGSQLLPPAKLPASFSKGVQTTRSFNSSSLKVSKVEDTEQKASVLVSDSVNGLVCPSGALIPGQVPHPSGCMVPGVQLPDQIDIVKPTTQLKLQFIVNRSSHPITVQIPSSSVIVNSQPTLYQLLPQQQSLQHPVPQASVEGSNRQQAPMSQPAVVITVDRLGSFLLPQATLLEQSTPGQNIFLQNFQPPPPAQLQQGQGQAQSAQPGVRQGPFPEATLTMQNAQPPHSRHTNQRKGKAKKATPTVPKP